MPPRPTKERELVEVFIMALVVSVPPNPKLPEVRVNPLFAPYVVPTLELFIVIDDPDWDREIPTPLIKLTLAAEVMAVEPVPLANKFQD